MSTQKRLLILGVALLSLGGAAAPLRAADASATLTAAIKVETEDGQVSYFKSVSGLSQEIEVVEFREGGDGTVIRKIPGRVKWPAITFKRGYFSGNTDFYDWVRAIGEGTLVRKDLSITLLNARGDPVARYHLTDAWPSKWETGTETLAAGRGGEVAIETITIVHEGIRRVQ